MNKIRRTFAENLEELELSKVIRKYEDLGYRFQDETTILGRDFDAIAVNHRTGDKIVFEVKAMGFIKKGDNDSLVKKREFIRQNLPDARFIVVLAQEEKKSDVLDSSLNELLLNFIDFNHKNALRELIPKLGALDSVQKLSITKFDFGNFSKIHLEGFANLLFYEEVSTREFRGERLTDGIPFEFKIDLVRNPAEITQIDIPYSISREGEIIFDPSEFK